MPFLELASIHRAGSHLSSPMGLSSKIVPSFTENCRPHSRHFQMRRVLRKPGSLPSQAGQVTPFGQRRDARKVSAVSLSEKYRIASVNELGKRLVLAMHKGTSGGLVCQVCYCPNKRLKLRGALVGGIALPRRLAFLSAAPTPYAGGQRARSLSAIR